MPLDTKPDVADLLVDRRAEHYWDGDSKLGHYVANLEGDTSGRVAWDMFLVYGPNAKWGDQPIASGAPVVSTSGELESALRPYLSPA